MAFAFLFSAAAARADDQRRYYGGRWHDDHVILHSATFGQGPAISYATPDDGYVGPQTDVTIAYAGRDRHHHHHHHD